MNRLNECDKFLKQMAYISKNTSLTSSNIYSYLVRIDVPQEYWDIDLSNIFPYWINHFQNEPNINVYVDPKCHTFVNLLILIMPILNYVMELKCIYLLIHNLCMIVLMTYLNSWQEIIFIMYQKLENILDLII